MNRQIPIWSLMAIGLAIDVIGLVLDHPPTRTPALVLGSGMIGFGIGWGAATRRSQSSLPEPTVRLAHRPEPSPTETPTVEIVGAIAQRSEADAPDERAWVGEPLEDLLVRIADLTSAKRDVVLQREAIGKWAYVRIHVHNVSSGSWGVSVYGNCGSKSDGFRTLVHLHFKEADAARILDLDGGAVVFAVGQLTGHDSLDRCELIRVHPERGEANGSA